MGSGLTAALEMTYRHNEGVFVKATIGDYVRSRSVGGPEVAPLEDQMNRDRTKPG